MRVNVESSALAEGRFTKLANELFEGSRVEAIGTLVLFWHDSQEREFVAGTKKEIVSFLPYLETKGNENLFKAFLKYGYIKKIENGRYEISGNKQHVESIQGLRALKRKAGLASAEARKNKSSTHDEHPLTPIEHVLPSVDRNSMQFNAIQSSSKQINSKQLSSSQISANLKKQKPDIIDEDFERVWAEYPRRVDKTEARDRFFRLITDTRDLQDLEIAVINYAADCRRLKTADKYIKHFSAFLGTEQKQKWRDWIDYIPPMNEADKIEAEFIARHEREVSP